MKAIARPRQPMYGMNSQLLVVHRPESLFYWFLEALDVGLLYSEAF
jgi:hypothetical protein